MTKENMRCLKRERKKNRDKKIRKFLKFLAFLIIFLSLLFLAIFLFAFTKDSKWSLGKHINIVFNSSPLIIFSFEPSTNSAYLISVKDPFYVKVGESGFYKLNDVYKLGELRGNKGSLLLKDTTQDVFYAPIDDIVLLPQEGDNLLDKKGKSSREVLREIFKEGVFSKSKALNLTKFDFLKLYFVLGKKVNLDSMGVDKKSYGKVLELEDGRKIDVLDELKILKLGEYFLDETIADEGLTISVVNRTQISGLGKSVAKMLENSGLRVIEVSSENTPLEKNCLLIANETVSRSYTFRRIKKVFSCNFEISSVEKARSDMVFNIGENW